MYENEARRKEFKVKVGSIILTIMGGKRVDRHLYCTNSFGKRTIMKGEGGKEVRRKEARGLLMKY